MWTQTSLFGIVDVIVLCLGLCIDCLVLMWVVVSESGFGVLLSLSVSQTSSCVWPLLQVRHGRLVRGCCSVAGRAVINLGCWVVRVVPVLWKTD